MNYYLIWTDRGWMRTPTYNHPICRGLTNGTIMYDNINATYDIRYAYRFDEGQIKDALEFLQGFGVASWAVECKEDFLKEVLDNLKKKRVGSN